MNDNRVVPLSVVREAASIVDSSGVAAMLSNWENSDQTYRGGRASTLPLRAILIAWLVVAIEELPLHLTRVAELLTARLSPKAAETLGISYAFSSVLTDIMYDRAHRATQRLVDVLDYEPLPTRQRRLLKSEWTDTQRERAERADELEAKRRRLFRFANELLRTQYDSLPEETRTDDVSLTVDATFLKSFGRGMSSRRLEKRRDDQTVPSEPDAGWYIRTYDQNDTDGAKGDSLKKQGWGWEYELTALISNEPSRPRAVPHIVVGFNHHKPGAQPSAAAREIFDDVTERGLSLDHVGGDQAYLPGAKSEVLQNPLRKQGAKLVMKYAVSQAGRQANGEGTIQGEAHGAVMVEGQWYCPALPAALRDVMVEYQRNIKADRGNLELSPTERASRKAEHDAHRDRQIEERRRWEMRAKERPDENGKVPMRCPAVGPIPHTVVPSQAHTDSQTPCRRRTSPGIEPSQVVRQGLHE